MSCVCEMNKGQTKGQLFVRLKSGSVRYGGACISIDC